MRPPKADLDRVSKGVGILARATRKVFSRVFQRGMDAAQTKREVCAEEDLLVRHYSGCRADAIAAARGWRERLHEERARLRARLGALERKRDADGKRASKRRRNAVATRKAETRLAQVEKELAGRPRHCFGGRYRLRKGELSEWRESRAGNALFAGETGKAFGNEVARWNAGRLELKLPGGLGAVVLEEVRFAEKVERDLQRCVEVRTPVSWRVKLLSKGKVQLCVTVEESEPALAPEQGGGVLAVDLNADHLAVARVSGDGRLLGVWRRNLEADRDSVQQAARWVVGLAAELGVSVVAEDLEFRKKKAWLREYGKRFAGILSGFRTRQVMAALERQCCRRGVELIVVDPAWTTRIPRAGRYPDRYRIGLHQAAALVIGRRGLGFAERMPKTASPLERAEVKRRGTRGWESVLWQWLPVAWRHRGRRKAGNRPGAREGPVGAGLSAPA